MFKLIFNNTKPKATIDQLYQAFEDHPEIFNQDEMLDFLFLKKLQELKKDLKSQGYLNN